MLRVYLDQAKWIDLAKYRAGHPDGKKFETVFKTMPELVDRGRVSFVLSCAHYFETQRRAKLESRYNLAWTMAELSRFHTIAPPHAIVPAEIHEVLVGDPLSDQLNLFGVGFNHAFKTNVSFGRVDPDLLEALPPLQRTEFNEAFDWLVEFGALAVPPISSEIENRTFEAALKIRDGDQMFADTQAMQAAHVASNKLRGPRLSDWATASEIADFLPALMAVCKRNAIDLDEVLTGKERIHRFLESLPSRWVSRELRRVRLRNPEQPWHPHDLNDVNALSIAVPYCDIVVTERQWAAHINKEGLAEKYGTTVLHDLTKLTDHL